MSRNAALSEAQRDAFANIVGPEHVLTDLSSRQYFSRDLFPWDDAPLTAAVVAPGSVADVQAVVRAARQHGLNIVTRGGGMSTGRSYVPADVRSVTIDMRRLNAIHEINVADRYMIVGAGCTWEQVHKVMPKGWTCETRAPLSGNYSTVGGAVAHGYPGGIKGILGVEVVRANGDVVRTGVWGRAKTSGAYYREYGPDLTGLFIGDTGAFGIKTAVALHLVAPPRARATASFGYDRFEDVAATFVELAHLDVLTTRFCFDPYDTATLTAANSRDAVKVAAKILGSAPSIRQRIVEGIALIRAGLGHTPKACWSLNLVAEQFSQDAASAAIAEAERICLRRGRKIPNVIAIASAAPVYSVRRFLGRDGERWIATNAIFAIGRAVEVVRKTEAFFAARRVDLDRHRIRVGYIAQVTPVHFQIEPLFYWPDQLDELHLRHLSDGEAERFRNFPPNPETRKYVLGLRAELRDFFEDLGSIHVHLSKFFRYAEVLSPQTGGLLHDIKAALDPAMMINPGNLGLRESDARADTDPNAKS